MLSAVMIPYKISVYKNQYNSNRFYNITYRRINQLFFCENNTNIAKHHTHICILFHNGFQHFMSIFICKKVLFAAYSKNQQVHNPVIWQGSLSPAIDSESDQASLHYQQILCDNDNRKLYFWEDWTFQGQCSS